MHARSRLPLRSPIPLSRTSPRRASPASRAAVLLLTLLASCGSCTERTPGVCCTSDPECARLGLPPGSASEYSCRQGEVCRDFYCAPEETAPDASAPDATPIVDNGQRAELVLGQESFTTADENHGGRSASSLLWPVGVAVDDTDRPWVFDLGNSRALMWSPAPVVSFAAAALVIGAPDFTSLGSSCSGPTNICKGYQIAAKGGKLVIPTGLATAGATPVGGNRVMIWNPAPIMNGAASNTVLGQANFSDFSPGNGAADLNEPTGAWTDGARLVVADSGNNRVLIWTVFPTTNKQPADIVLGQPDFGMSGSPSTPTGASMRRPYAVHSDGVRLFVADADNSRVLVWRSFPTTHGQPADIAIGQPDLTSNGTGHGAAQLWGATGVTTVGDHLFVSDPGNNRVLEFSPIPTTSGASALSVLGQPSFETTSAGTTQDTLHTPENLAVSGNKLYVTDTGNNRVMRFDLKL